MLGLLASPLLVEWARTCAASSRLSYALLVPLLAAVLAWRSRELSPGVPTRPDDPAVRASALAAVLFVTGGLTGIFTLSVLAIPVTVVVWVRRTGGRAAVRRHAAALALLFLMVPPPMPLMDRATPLLVSLSGRTAVTLLWPLDPASSWVGSTLGFRGWNLVVAEACSGSGTFLMLGVLAAFLAGLFRLRPASTAAVLALVFPLTLLVNGLRIASSAVVIDTFGAAAGEGTAHELLGQVVVLGGAALLVWGVERHGRVRTAEVRP